MNQELHKPTLRRAVCLLLASTGLGLASNALNPAGLRWNKTNAEREFETTGDAGAVGIYRNETLYANETLSAKPAPKTPLTADQHFPSARANATTGEAPTRSTWAEIKSMVESRRIVLVDARTRSAFDAGHIPGAVSLPFKDFASEIQAFMAAYPLATPLAIYCANANCGTSSQLATTLTRIYKFENVRYLPGGYQEWRNAEGK